MPGLFQRHASSELTVLAGIMQDGALTRQSDVIKKLVACACETGEPSPQALSLLGQEITLLQLQNQAPLAPMPEEG